MTWLFSISTLTCNLLFPIDMDDSVIPLATDFVIIADGVPKVPFFIFWATNRRLDLEYTEPSLDPTTVRLQLPAAVQDFRDATLHLVFPFDILGVPA